MSEVKLLWVWLVHGRETALENQMLLPIYMTYVDARGYHCHLICLPIGYGRLNGRFAWSNPEKRYINKAALLYFDSRGRNNPYHKITSRLPRSNPVLNPSEPLIRFFFVKDNNRRFLS